MTEGNILREHQTGVRSSVDPRIPVYVVIGPEGRAKAALIGSLASRTRGNVALALSDARSWQRHISGAEPVSGLPDMMRMSNGGICVDAGADPVKALYQLHLRRLGLLKPRLNYDAVIFESGTNVDTGAFAAVVQNDTRIELTYRIVGVLHAIEIVDRPYRSSFVQQRHIGEADTIILVPSREEGTDALGEAAAAASSLNPLAKIVSLGQFGTEPLRPVELDARRNKAMVRLPSYNSEIDALVNNLFSDPVSNNHGSEPLRALSVRLSGEADMLAALRVVGRLRADHGSDLLRLSAVLNVRHADYPIALDVIGGTLLHPSFHSDAWRPDCEISILARGLDVARTLEALEQCGREKRIRKEDLSVAI